MPIVQEYKKVCEVHNFIADERDKLNRSRNSTTPAQSLPAWNIFSHTKVDELVQRVVSVQLALLQLDILAVQQAVLSMHTWLISILSALF